MNRKPWTEVEIALLRWGFADSRTEDIASVLGRSYSTVAQKAARLGLKKSEAYLASPVANRLDGAKGASTRFQPGLVPWNKGLRGVVGVQDKCRATQFKPGGRPHTWVPVGSHRVVSDGYLEVKLNDLPGPSAVRWRPVHRLVWETANGPAPKGCVVVFRPGAKTTDPQAITLDKLECITRRENMLRNSVHAKYPPELARLAQLRGAITRQINRKAKEATSS